ncbi:HesA/MoeB/ThiF family protein [Zavarzinella formosa]|uniref:HesA/MoeB/ThiF family protein n=1 Tax=Zavarzinella formosa TaxID=360055 RepID=UPI0004963618|nr:ThiF family adenylyltransferase [Zavarzinella formosa]
MSERYSRQGFLGMAGQLAIETARVAVNGLGGGGSHIAPQLAHLGVQNFLLYDHDRGDESNLNRTMTLAEADVEAGTLKVEAARRRIHEINPRANVEIHPCRWQDREKALNGCTLVMGCVDSFGERQQIEACCRRLLIPYIDIGMDVHPGGEEPPGMSGQVILSMPGLPCMFCMGFLTDEKIGREVANYGAAGGKPQVVWPNGVLASTAVGIAVSLLTGWTRSSPAPVYLSYNGTDGTLVPHIRLKYLPPEPCEHYPLAQAGEPVFVKI